MTGGDGRRPIDQDRLLDVHEAAMLLRLQPRTLYKLAYERRLPVVKLGRSTRFRLSSVLDLIAASERPADPPLAMPSATRAIRRW
jgi:excisionase family DNA binding protein